MPPSPDDGRAAEQASPLPSPFVGAPPAQPLRLVPAAHGRIEELLLTVPPHRDPTGSDPVFPPYERHLRALVAGMGADRRYTIVCHDHQRSRAASWLREAGVDVEACRFVRSTFGYSLWAQDACLALGPRDPAAPSPHAWLCQGAFFPRFEDSSVFPDIAVQSSHRLLHTFLYFQGGNVLGTPGLAIIGKDTIWKNRGRAFLENEARVLDQFERLCGTQVLAIGTDHLIPREGFPALTGYHQPIIHIDMYVMPTGVVGESGREIVFVGRPARARELLGEPARPGDHDLYFEGAAEALSARFEVRSLPLLPVDGNLAHAGVPLRHYHLSWTNAVVETWRDTDGSERRSVLLPTYSEDADDFGVDRRVREHLDAEAAAAWGALGFAVRRMDGLEDLAFSVGSVHCMVKDLRRGPPPNPPL